MTEELKWDGVNLFHLADVKENEYYEIVKYETKSGYKVIKGSPDIYIKDDKPIIIKVLDLVYDHDEDLQIDRTYMVEVIFISHSLEELFDLNHLSWATAATFEDDELFTLIEYAEQETMLFKKADSMNQLVMQDLF